MFDTPQKARIARCIRIGRNRAAFWRKLGFPNLVLARQARWRGHKKKSEPAEQRPRGF